MTTAQLLQSPNDTAALLWPYLRKSHSHLTAIKTVELHSLGSVQKGRGVVRITVHGKSKTKNIVIDLFANYDVKGDSKTIYQFLAFLERRGFGAGAYGTPTPLCYIPKHKLLVYQSFAGTRARDLLETKKLSSAKLNSIMRQSAIWLKKFHHLPPQIGKKRNLTLSPAFFSKLSLPHQKVVAAALPYINRELKKNDRRSLVHGDPHLANCILGPKNSFAFIDFSESHVGSAAADIGMYLVHLDVALQPFFTRREIAKAQRIFVETYYGKKIETLPKNIKRSVLAFELRTASLFLRFTSDHHRQPNSQVRWMIQRFVNIVSRGTSELQSFDPLIILAS